ncbi:MAG: ATP-binding cassette domain-containing protein [Oscillospiraceae bacterium]|nr:ATP-binding cassette domain-containing protein [Oscillospiraceae bacterium]
MSMIELNKVGKQFKDTWVLQDITMSVEAGSICGLVGRNGSGKTMIMKLIAGMVAPTAGSISVEGKRLGTDVDIPDSLRAIIEVPGFLGNMSGFRNLQYLASPRKQIDDDAICRTMEQVGLDPNDKKRVGKYSLGMRQRLGIAQAIMEQPRILLLDEPMNGLDNQGVQDIRALMKELRDQGKAILLASHHREDIDQLCDRVYTLDGGRMVS